MQLDTMLTADEYARLPRSHGQRHELMRGLLVRRPHPSPQHATVAARIYDLLRPHAERLGARAVVDGRFVLQSEPPTIRGPDVALVDSPAEGVVRGAPRLAVEVATPDTDGARAELLEKVFEYLDAGTSAVWLVDLGRRSVTTFEQKAEPKTYRSGQTIVSNGPLRGIDCRVSALFG